MNFIKINANLASKRPLGSGPRKSAGNYRVFAPSADFWQPTWAPVATAQSAGK